MSLKPIRVYLAKLLNHHKRIAASCEPITAETSAEMLQLDLVAHQRYAPAITATAQLPDHLRSRWVTKLDEIMGAHSLLIAAVLMPLPEKRRLREYDLLCPLEAALRELDSLEGKPSAGGYEGLVVDETDDVRDKGIVTAAAKPLKPKRSTKKGEARDKLIAALLLHHKYDREGCLNWEPIGNNDLARAAGKVSPTSAKNFFDKYFGIDAAGDPAKKAKKTNGHYQYRALCLRNPIKVLNVLKALNRDFAVDDLYGDSLPSE